MDTENILVVATEEWEDGWNWLKRVKISENVCYLEMGNDYMSVYTRENSLSYTLMCICIPPPKSKHNSSNIFAKLGPTPTEGMQQLRQRREVVCFPLDLSFKIQKYTLP